MDEIIKVNDVSMRLIHAQEKSETLKEYTVILLTHKLFFNEFYALKHVSFSMKRGESLALIGRNGSGKSTMLKVISGVMYPSGGSVAVNGEIAPMIELGAGIDMDLPARETIFLNGAVLGHDRDYMMEHFDRIIEFSELKDFVDVPVKNFSSGMIARLGFSIATEVQADILVCDEVLAVGDFMFQQKCHRRMEEMLSNGTTLLFVSHDRYFINRFATRIWELADGTINDYPMGFAQYRAAKAEEKKPAPAPVQKKKQDTRPPRAGREKQAARRQLTICETGISKLEERCRQLDAEMEQNACDVEKLQELYREKQNVEAQLEQEMARWEELSLQLEE